MSIPYYPKKSEARRLQWSKVPKEKRVEIARRCAQIRWMRTTPAMRKQFTRKINKFKNVKSKKF